MKAMERLLKWTKMWQSGKQYVGAGSINDGKTQISRQKLKISGQSKVWIAENTSKKPALSKWKIIIVAFSFMLETKYINATAFSNISNKGF